MLDLEQLIGKVFSKPPRGHAKTIRDFNSQLKGRHVIVHHGEYSCRGTALELGFGVTNVDHHGSMIEVMAWVLEIDVEKIKQGVLLNSATKVSVGSTGEILQFKKG